MQKDVVEKKEAAEGCQHINERGANKGNPCSKKCVENSNYCKVMNLNIKMKLMLNLSLKNLQMKNKMKKKLKLKNQNLKII